MYRIFLLLILISFAFYICTAQSTEWINYKPNPYLSTIKCAGDNVWIGTEEGLFKFNKINKSVTCFTTENSPLPSNFILALAVSKSGTLWIGTKGLVKLENSAWEVDTATTSPTCLFHSNYINAMNIDSAGNIWYGTGDCLVKFNGETREFISFGNLAMSHFEIDDILFDKQGFIWLSTEVGLVKTDGTNIIDYGQNIYANYLALDKSGRLWIANYLGLVSFDGVNQTLYNSENSALPDDDIHCLQFDPSGVLWLGTDKGLTRFDGTHWTTYNTANSGLPENEIRTMDIDTYGNIWLGLRHYGLVGFDGTNWQNYQLVDRMIPSGRVIRDIEIDKNNSIWFGSRDGLIKYKEGGWILYNTLNSGIPDNEILSVTSDKNGNLWIGTSWVESGRSCLSMFDGENWVTFDSVLSTVPDIENSIKALEVDAAGNLWIGLEYHGLIKYDGTDWSLYDRMNSSLPSDRITQLLHDGKDNLWIGTGAAVEHIPDELVQAGGLVKYNKGVFTTYNLNNTPLPYSSIGALAVDSSGTIWISTYLNNYYYFPDYCGGVSRFDGQTWTTFDTSNSLLTHNSIASIQVDSKNNIWIGSYRDGLIKINTSGDWKSYITQNSKILSNNIRTLAIDKKDNIWISYGESDGLSIFKEGGISSDIVDNYLPERYHLFQNYPNPFNAKTTIKYSLQQASHVEIKVYNLLGEEIATIVNQYQHTGIYRTKVDLTSSASGIYFCTMKAGNFIKTFKMVLIK